MNRNPDRVSAARASRVRVQVATRAAKLPAAAELDRWVMAAGAGGRGAVTVRLVGWRESRRLNENFCGRAQSTNVLSFPAADGLPGPETELGDLVICLPLVFREARVQGKEPLHHLAHLVVHGTLHLLGHDHERAAGARRMETRERRILRRLGIPDPYREDPGARTRGRRRSGKHPR